MLVATAATVARTPAKAVAPHPTAWVGVLYGAGRFLPISRVATPKNPIAAAPTPDDGDPGGPAGIPNPDGGGPNGPAFWGTVMGSYFMTPNPDGGGPEGPALRVTVMPTPDGADPGTPLSINASLRIGGWFFWSKTSVVGTN